MTKIVCDRCGKEAQEENNVAFFEPHYCTQTDGHRFVTKESYDLCDECIAELIKWIGRKGKHYRTNTVYPGTNMIMTYCEKTGIAESNPDRVCADGKRRDKDGQEFFTSEGGAAE